MIGDASKASFLSILESDVGVSLHIQLYIHVYVVYIYRDWNELTVSTYVVCTV